MTAAERRTPQSGLAFPAISLLELVARAARVTRKPRLQKSLAGKFPQIPAPFPGSGAQSADFGQNLQNSSLRSKKIAAKFPAAGNLRRGTLEQKKYVWLVRARPASGFEDQTKT